MGEACADALDKYPGYTVLHVNGGFHSAYWDGTVHQLKLRKPNVNVRTVAAVPTANPAVEAVQGEPDADFVAFVEARATDLNEGMYSVYAPQQIKYRLHMPQQASPDHPVPLLIFLTDDGFTASDGLDLWKERLGSEAALAIVEAPYRETQEDFGIGGRWFWPDRSRPMWAGWSAPWSPSGRTSHGTSLWILRESAWRAKARAPRSRSAWRCWRTRWPSRPWRWLRGSTPS